MVVSNKLILYYQKDVCHTMHNRCQQSQGIVYIYLEVPKMLDVRIVHSDHPMDG